MDKKKNDLKSTKKTTSKEEVVLTKEQFLQILNRVIRPVKEQVKKPKKEKKGTSE